MRHVFCFLFYVTGGIREMFLFSTHTCERVFISGRRGLFQLSIQTNVPLVPIYAFGENRVGIFISSVLNIYLFRKVFRKHFFLHRFRLFLSRTLRTALPLFSGILVFSFFHVPQVVSILSFHFPFLLTLWLDLPYIHPLTKQHICPL